MPSSNTTWMQVTKLQDESQHTKNTLTLSGGIDLFVPTNHPNIACQLPFKLVCKTDLCRKLRFISSSSTSLGPRITSHRPPPVSLLKPMAAFPIERMRELHGRCPEGGQKASNIYETGDNLDNREGNVRKLKDKTFETSGTSCAICAKEVPFPLLQTIRLPIGTPWEHSDAKHPVPCQERVLLGNGWTWVWSGDILSPRQLCSSSSERCKALTKQRPKKSIYHCHHYSSRYKNHAQTNTCSDLRYLIMYIHTYTIYVWSPLCPDTSPPPPQCDDLSTILVPTFSCHKKSEKPTGLQPYMTIDVIQDDHGS